ncbi:Hypothetical protein [Corynebacterium glutamicum ATCC 13032]|uniref:Uncharacterized protein n=1 Tax=Corynebacterium glutamicum (strain ATCC 13032 / DSM 20300 / JCM 1318 / BCRC 11384 / CCUG 27702 / LMG 3730 / NBRC 12168 / NCIMB 10025 / NRRL B-2784 / 534) TaxID=196627 RepID=Q8NN00_CORGL|nr:Hypothetical protein [Corynebacterium glutamicum ATCC 13032]
MGTFIWFNVTRLPAYFHETASVRYQRFHRLKKQKNNASRRPVARRKALFL